MTPEDLDKTNPGATIIPLHKDFIIDTSNRLSESERKLFNLADDVDLILNKKLPIMDRKLDRILDGQREINGRLMSLPKRNSSIVVWTAIALCYLLFGFLILK